MSNLSRTLTSLALVAAGAIGFWLLGESDVPTRPPAKPTPPTVKTVEASEHLDGINFDVDGVVVPFRQIEIAAQVAGRVEFKSPACRVGRAVKQGDLLIRVEQQDYELEAARLREEVNQAGASIAELEAEIATTKHQIATAEAQLTIASRQLKRSRELVDRKVSSEAEVDTTLRAELEARDALQRAQDQLNLQTTRRGRLESAQALSRANLDKAILALQRTEIRSPIDGVVVSESVEQDGFLQTGSPIISLHDTSELDITCKLHMKQMHWLWQSMDGDVESLTDAYDFPETPATVIYELAGTTFAWDAEVDRYDGAGIDSQTRMIPCRVHVANPLAVKTTVSGEKSYLASSPPTLMTGMFVKVRIHATPPIPLVRLPQEAVQPGGKVWTVENGRLKRKPVNLATTSGDYVIAYQEIGGLQAGDQVVVTPLAIPVDGQEVWDIDNLPEEATASTGGPPGAGGPRNRGERPGKSGGGAKPAAAQPTGRGGKA